jgi:tetratricopeptide (TPR) repeat protein
MKTRTLVLITILLAVFINACEKREILGKQQLIQIITARTLGLAYLEENRLKEADAEFRKVIEIAPKEALGYANLGLVYFRKGRHPEAEEWIKKALAIAPDNPDIRLLLANVYEMANRENEALQELEQTLKNSSAHARTRYNLAELYLKSNQDKALQRAEEHLNKLSQLAPANIVVRLQLIETLLGNGKAGEEAVRHLEELRQQMPGLPAEAAEFYDKALAIAQANQAEAALTPARIFHNTLKSTPLYQAGILELRGPSGPLIGFPIFNFSQNLSTQIQEQKALPTAIRFTDVTSFVGLEVITKMERESAPTSEPCTHLAVADYDGDGDQDLFVGNRETSKNKTAPFFFKNDSSKFIETSSQAGINHSTRETAAVFADYDNDGRLDLYIVNDGSNILYRNLGNGKFLDVTKMAGVGDTDFGHAARFVDLDHEGDLDLFLTNAATNRVYRNNGDGTFEKDTRSQDLSNALRSVIGLDAAFGDFDNDGFLDLFIAGKEVLLFHNDGTGKFQDATSLLPENLFSGRRIALADYDDDGDMDIFVAGLDGGVRLLRNDGGNVNHYLKVQLVGIRTGSGKNSYFGIGAKLEIRAGDLYQMRVVTAPISHFGLGQHLEADVVRIQWPNGVPQNSFHTASDQQIVEKQILKGSCPFLYTWDGEKYTFVTDIFWRSAIGMPLGIMAGATTYAFSNSTQEYLKIPGNLLKAKDGVYSLQITEELWETPYLEEVKLIAIDHPDTVDIYIDEKFAGPPYPPLQIHTVAEKHLPISAADERGNDLLLLISRKDDLHIANLRPTKYQGITEMHDLILDLGDLSAAGRVVLFLNGWLFPTDASINMAISQSEQTKVISPFLQVMNRHGHWQTVIENLSFPMGKHKIVVADLTNKFLTHDHRVRIRTNMQIYWDYIFFATEPAPAPIRETVLRPVSADLHYRGFSSMYRKGGPYGPHWFDYQDVSAEPKWRDLEGYYTCYGDVLPLLLKADDKYVIFNSGDEVTVTFDAAATPPPGSGWVRDFLIYCDGWLKDGDLNTAHGKTVAPLPFHGMTRYPYGDDESYPQDKSHQEYLGKYNTRKVSQENYRRWLSNFSGDYKNRKKIAFRD